MRRSSRSASPRRSWGIPSDPRFLAIAAKRLCHLFPSLPKQPGFHKRRARLSDTIEALIAEFARISPGFYDDVLLVDSTPVECARSVETTRRSALAEAADYGYCASHSRFFWGFRLHGLFAPDGTPRALALTSPKLDERAVAAQLLARCGRGGETLIGDKRVAPSSAQNPTISVCRHSAALRRLCRSQVLTAASLAGGAQALSLIHI